MERIFHLSFLLDTYGDNRIDLVSFYELSKLDRFIIDRFKNTKDVRKKYDADISELCIDNMKFIKKENERNHRDWLGSIAIICEEKDKADKTIALYKIPIIYQKNKKLLSKENCLLKIKQKLSDKSIVKKIFETKRYLLSDYEIDLLYKDYTRGDDKYLKSFVGNFYNRLKRCKDDELLYFYCRSLMNIFNLDELSLETNFGTINHIQFPMPTDTILEKEWTFSDNAHLNDLIQSENYDEMFKVYDFDEINRKSNFFERGRNK